MTSARTIIGEVVRAVAVLALVFLSFAPMPAIAAHDGYGAAGIADYCGTPPVDRGSHAPCHACRANPVVLPTAPAQADPAFAVVPVCLNVSNQGLSVSLPERTPAYPRAPPALV